MIEVFADTFYWLALLNTRDTHHDRVLSFQVSGSVVTTWAVQLEVMNAFCERRHRPLAVRFWQETTTDQGLVTIPAD
jgi:predicted nucleic acid-binding protein